jgi:hypothetical protein
MPAISAGMTGQVLQGLVLGFDRPRAEITLLGLARIFRAAIVDAGGERLRAALEAIPALALGRADGRRAPALVDATVPDLMGP